MVDSATDRDNAERSASPETIKVYLRLRPKNKVETMKRSKDCIELHDNPKIITVDSPLLGEFEFSFDQVFDEYSSQEEVYRECISHFPHKLLQGISTTFITYGQTGTGKTYSLLGDKGGAVLSLLTDRPCMADVDVQVPDSQLCPGGTEGIVPRVVAHLFDVLYESTAADSCMEYTIRCSFVEIYLERMTDLLQPGRREGLRVGQYENGEYGIIGATQLCCLCPDDVYALLARGRATRTKTTSDAETDSSKSHAIFTLHLEQIDKVEGKHKVSKMQIVDLGGSETRPHTVTTDPSIATENRMINASLESFQRLVNWTLQNQQSPQTTTSTTTLSRPSLSKLATLLQTSVGGNTCTAMLCTGSPSSYNINETISTIRFGQLMRKVLNNPRACSECSIRSCRARLVLAERRQQQLTSLLRLMALECKHLKKKTREPKNPKVWEAVLQIAEADRKAAKDEGKSSKNKIGDDGDKRGKGRGSIDDADFSISIHSRTEEELEIELLRTKVAKLESELQEERTAREKIQAKFRDFQSELAALKGSNESILADKRKLALQLADARAKYRVISTQKEEVEHRLRTSQFRESEAILFLRQLRTFYFRLLKNKAAHGSGGTRYVIDEVKKRIPGVTDLEDLLDVDKMMIKSGIIDPLEAGKDTLVGDHFPSREALENSAMEAEKAARREMGLVQDALGADSQRERNEDGKMIDASGERFSNSGLSNSLNDCTHGQLAAYRQKLLLTPAGLLAIQKEKELEQDLLDLSKKCIGLQNAVNAEKAMVEALSSRQGATTKLKQAQELNTLKQELELRTNDLHAIVWKMNELHLVNKMIDSKVSTLEQQLKYLEDHVSEMQAQSNLLISNNEKREKRLRDENSELRSQLHGLAVSVWQFGERLDKRPMWRISVPCSLESVDLAERCERRLSGTLTEADIDGLVNVVEDTCDIEGRHG